MRPPPIVVCACASLLAAGCSSEEEAGHADHSAFVDRFAERYCALATTCCAALGTPNDPDACKSSVKSVLGANGASLDSGRASFDAQAAEQCLSELDGFMASCAPPRERPEVCDRVVRGKLQAGAACKWSTDCAPVDGKTVFCKFDDESAQGICVAQPPPAVGMACEETTCDADGTLYCDFSSSTCATRPIAGESCDPIDVPCTTGTSCIGAGGGAYQCAAELPIGGDCSAGEPCVAGSYCAGGVCAAQKPAGEPCVAGSNDCLSACDGLVCEPVEPPNMACYPND